MTATEERVSPSSRHPPTANDQAGRGGMTAFTSLVSSLARSLSAAAYYIFSSLLLTVVVKVLLQSPALTLPVPLLLFLQALSTLLIFFALATCTALWTVPSLPTTTATIRSYLPLLAAYATMLASSVSALSLTSLLMYNTLRRISLLFVVVLQAIYTRSTPTPYTLVATVLSVAGATYAGIADLSFDLRGYSLAMLANASGAVYMILLTPVRDALDYSNLDLLFVNTCAVTPLLLLFFLLTSAPLSTATALFAHLATHPAPAATFAAACTLTFFLNHATYLNTAINNPVAQTVSAQLRDVLLLGISVAFIDNAAHRGPGNITGVLIGLAGSVIYAYGRLVGAQRRATEGAEGAEGATAAGGCVAKGTAAGYRRVPLGEEIEIDVRETGVGEAEFEEGGAGLELAGVTGAQEEITASEAPVVQAKDATAAV